MHSYISKKVSNCFSRTLTEISFGKPFQLFLAAAISLGIDFYLDGGKIIDRCSQWSKRLFF